MAHYSALYAHRWHRDSSVPNAHHEGTELENNIKPAVRSGDVVMHNIGPTYSGTGQDTAFHDSYEGKAQIKAPR